MDLVYIERPCSLREKATINLYPPYHNHIAPSNPYIIIAFVDIKSFLYNIVNDKFVQHFNISCVFIQSCLLKNVIDDMKSIKKIIYLNINFLNQKNKEICMYIFNKTLNYNMLLKRFWIKKTMWESMQKTYDYTSKNQNQKFINKTKKSLLNVIPYWSLRTPYE